MNTAKIYTEQFSNLNQFPVITYTKLNKEYRQEIISIYKLRTQSYNFRKDL